MALPRKISNHDVMLHRLRHHEASPAYNCLRDAGLLENSYRRRTHADLDIIPENSTIVRNKLRGCIPGHLTARINAGEIGLLADGRGGFDFLGPGLHCHFDPFLSLKGRAKLTDPKIIFGDRAIVTVPQGFIGVVQDSGQTILLPPGLHQWQSPTIRFHKLVDLTSSVIHIDPFTLVTVDEGYAAVTQDNGRMKILDGGSVYMLQHRNHKFEMFISQKIQTDELPSIKCASADNVVIAVHATVNWRIVDVETAARMAADTMLHGGGCVKKKKRLNKDSEDVHINDSGALDLGKLRNDVMKQAEASLSAFIALVNYSDTFGVSATVTQERGRTNAPVATAVPVESGSDDELAKSAALFDLTKLQSMVEHANEVTRVYGVSITSINIIQAFPADEKLLQSLAKGAVAAAEAQQAETAARGKAQALRINAAAEAEVNVALAKSEAEADRIRAEGAKDAAFTIHESQLAVELARIDRMGGALGNRTAFFFGAEPKDVMAKLAAKMTMKEVEVDSTAGA